MQCLSAADLSSSPTASPRSSGRPDDGHFDTMAALPRCPDSSKSYPNSICIDQRKSNQIILTTANDESRPRFTSRNILWREGQSSRARARFGGRRCVCGARMRRGALEEYMLDLRLAQFWQCDGTHLRPVVKDRRLDIVGETRPPVLGGCRRWRGRSRRRCRSRRWLLL